MSILLLLFVLIIYLLLGWLFTRTSGVCVETAAAGMSPRLRPMRTRGTRLFSASLELTGTAAAQDTSNSTNNAHYINHFW